MITTRKATFVLWRYRQTDIVLKKNDVVCTDTLDGRVRADTGYPCGVRLRAFHDRLRDHAVFRQFCTAYVVFLLPDPAGQIQIRAKNTTNHIEG